MLLKSKNVVIFAATGDIGRAVAQASAREGANLFLSGRDKGRVNALADSLRPTIGSVRATQVDATDEVAVERYLMALEGVGVDVVFNAIGIRAEEGGYGMPAEVLPFASFMRPVQVHLGSQFLTSRIAARQMRVDAPFCGSTSSARSRAHRRARNRSTPEEVEGEPRPYPGRAWRA